MNVRINFYTLLVTLGLITLGCSNDVSDNEIGNQGHILESTMEEHDSEETNDTDSSEFVHLTNLQINTAGIKYGVLELLPLNETIKTSGFLELPPQNKATVSAVLGGIVKTIYVREGEAVRKGDILADLVDPKFSDIQAEYRKVNQQLVYLEAEYRRKEKLVNDDIGSLREFQLARSEYESTLAEVQSLESKLMMLNLDPDEILEGKIASSIPLKAPIGGFVRVIETNIGQFADPSSELFEIVDNEHLHIDLLVYEKDIHKLSVNQEVLFKYTNQPNEHFYQARIFSVGKAFEENPRAVRVHAEIVDQQDGLLPGMFVDGHVVTNTELVSVLPEGAILRNGEDFLVFAVNESNSKTQLNDIQNNLNEQDEVEFEVLRVRPGTTYNGYTEVRFFESVNENRRFVTEGAYYLLAEMKKGEGGHDH